MEKAKIVSNLDDIQWLLVPGTKPRLKQADFGPSDRLYQAVTARFSLKDQFRDGAVQKAFSEFAAAIRPQHIEASAVSVGNREIFVVTPRGHRIEAKENVAQIIHGKPELARLLSLSDLANVWQSAKSLDNAVVGGFDMRNKKFMFLLGRPPLEDAKALFSIPENPGRYKPRPERDPAFLSSGNIGVSVVEYSEQIEKARQHLQYFLRAGGAENRIAVCYVSHEFDTAARAQLAECRPASIYVMTQPRLAHGLLTFAQRTLRALSQAPQDEAESYLKTLKPV